MDKVYFGEFESVDDLVDRFSGTFDPYYKEEPGPKITEDRILKDLEGAEVFFASYDYQDYDGHALVVFRRDRELYMVEGSHCSCLGLEGQWEPQRVVPSVVAKASRCGMSPEAEAAFDLLIAKLGGDL